MPFDQAAVAGTAAAPSRHDGPRRTRWARIKPWLVGAFFVLVAVLLVRLSRNVDWALAWQSIRSYQPGTLAIAAALALASYAVYCGYDLLGRHHTGHGLPVVRVAGVGFVSYAFNLNLGALVGGVAVRYRLYSRLGLDTAVTTQVLALSMLTNWLGYLLVGGMVFVVRPLQLPPQWELDSGGLRLLGAGMLLVAALYVGLCLRFGGRDWTLRGHRLKLPGVGVALLQFALSSLNWLIIAGVVFVLLRDQVDYLSVLAVMLVAAVAGVISHVPAGLGVLEAVFLALLSHRAGQGELMAALLAYRALYYLAPLSLATVLFFATGMGAKVEAGRGRRGCG
jgi:uncharacterized membrane protein YbhN (UPF0104 family)